MTVAAVTLGGCSLGLEDLPAPSGTHGATYHVTAKFSDVQNLTLGAKVKLGGVVVGDVTSITTANFQAAVGMDLERQFPLGTDAQFQIRFTTPLGEDFVSVMSAGSHGRLTNDAVVPMAQTSNAPSIEDTFAAVSLLLNGGGLSKLQIIARELDTAFAGRTGNARDSLIKLDQLIGNLDQHKDDIDRVLDGLGNLAGSINRGTGLVVQALDLFPSTLQTLTTDTAQIRGLLQQVAALGNTVSGLLQRGQDAMLADFDNLRPTLDALRARQDELLPTFNSLIKLGQAVRRAAPGDYLNISGTIEFLLDATPARPKQGGVVHPGAEDAVHHLLTGGTG